MSELPVWWNIAQACVWVATREKRLVDRVWFSGARYSTANTISDRSLLDASIDVSVEQADRGEKLAITVSAARTHIADACAAGTIAMYGRPRGAGDLEQLSRVVWGNLEIRDHDDHGVVAASSDRFDSRASWWDELKLLRADIQRVWPAIANDMDTHLYSPSTELRSDPVTLPAHVSTVAPAAATAAPVPEEPNPAAVAQVSAETLPDDRVIKAWLTLEQTQKIEKDNPHGLNEVRIYLRDRFPHLSRDDADRFYAGLDPDLKPSRGPKGPWKNKRSQ